MIARSFWRSWSSRAVVAGRVGAILARAVAIVANGVDENGGLLQQKMVRVIREHPWSIWAYSVHCGLRWFAVWVSESWGIRGGFIYPAVSDWTHVSHPPAVRSTISAK